MFVVAQFTRLLHSILSLEYVRSRAIHCASYILSLSLEYVRSRAIHCASYTIACVRSRAIHAPLTFYQTLLIKRI